MWGQRWHAPDRKPPEEAPALPPVLSERRFWEGSAYGVAIQARSFPGFIIVHADARFLLNFREQVGVQRLMQDLVGRPGVAFALLEDDRFRVLAASDPSRVGPVEKDAFLAEAVAQGETRSRTTVLPGGARVHEVVRPFTLQGGRRGVLRLGLSTVAMEQVWRQDRLTLLLFTGGIVAVGILAIFFNQRRYLRGVRALEEEVRLRERLASLGNLAAGVAHEVRNPLNAISVGIQRLRRELPPAGAGERAEFDRFTEVMQGEVLRLNGIVERFLQLARPAPVHPKACDVASLIADLLALMGPEAAGRNITVRPVIPGPLPARVDPDQVTQVLHNLIANACQAMPDGGEVTVEAKAGEGGILISVTDGGEGIPAADLGKIFEPYFTTRARGTGLGLAIAHRIVEDHGGRIEVESRVGVGSTFRVRLPADGRGSPA